MAHKVKCPICGKIFDRDIVECVQIAARRYAHKTCINQDEKNLTQDVVDKDNFYQCIKQIYGKDYNYQLINHQAEEYIQLYNYTWTGMEKALRWFYILNQGSIEDSHGGVGIIPYIYDEAKQYYYELYLTQEKNKEKELRPEVVSFSIQSPRSWQRPPQLLDLGE